ncbi:hypothetical protein DFH07DRAFT_299738 [Mycena maculata]|uniref:F-box domain-containing protein n=1 Tax=Mycena maculata TaxID=230809 RepID=A0AAD7JNX0_9AGAR|nr:hypothetical protein DFH07DRAFT_299738 [Mycena maculata]
MLASSSTQASAARTLTASERAALAADRARIADIDIRVPEMEHALRTLREERDILRNRLDVYTYPVLTLPNEIVSQIFIQFLPVCPKCPPIFGLHSPNLLAHICGKWREIALSVPALWRGFAVPLAHAVPMARTLTLFDKFVKRSGSFPLSMELAQGSSSLDGINPLLGPASAHDHRGRWEHLNLKIPNFYLIPIHGPLPLLRSLHLAMLPRTGSLPLAPLLTNVSLITHFNNFSPTILPWSQLTSLAAWPALQLVFRTSQPAYHTPAPPVLDFMYDRDSAPCSARRISGHIDPPSPAPTLGR